MKKKIYVLAFLGTPLAEAIQELFPNAKFGIGPAIENGFYDVEPEIIPFNKKFTCSGKKFLELAEIRTNSFVHPYQIRRSISLSRDWE